MAKLFDEMIEELKNATGGEEDEVIRALRAKSAELDDDPDQSQIIDIMRSCVASCLAAKFESEHEAEDEDEDEDEDEIDEETLEYMQESAAIVEEFLDEHEWKYKTNKIIPTLTCFELGLVTKGVKLTMKIYVEAKPCACRIEAVLPFSADKLYEYPLCKMLEKINFRLRFGTFKYDERDGEISFDLGFLTQNGLFKDDLKHYFNATVSSCLIHHKKIRDCAVGRFKDDEVTEILEKIRELEDDIA